MAYSLPVAIRLLCLLWLPLACYLLLLGMEVAWDFSGNLLAFDVAPKGALRVRLGSWLAKWEILLTLRRHYHCASRGRPVAVSMTVASMG